MKMMREHKVVAVISIAGCLALFAGVGAIVLHNANFNFHFGDTGQVMGDTDNSGSAGAPSGPSASPQAQTNNGGIAANPEPSTNSLGQLSPLQATTNSGRSGQAL